MTLTLESRAAAVPALASGSAVRLARATSTMWRVIDRSGRVIGHLQAVAAAEGVRYRARRFHSMTRAFRELGEFWSADDAVECLRYAR